MRNYEKVLNILTRDEIDYIKSFSKGYFHLSQGDFERQEHGKSTDLYDRLYEVGVKGRWHRGYGIYTYKVPNYFYESI